MKSTANSYEYRCAFYLVTEKAELRELNRILKAKKLNKGLWRPREEARKGVALLDETSMRPESKGRLRGLVEFVTGSLDWYR